MMSYILIFLVAFYFSAFFSGAEMAFTSANKLKFREEAEGGNREAEKIVRLQEQPERFLTAVLIGNNITHVVGTAVLAYVLDFYLHIRNEWVSASIMTVLLLIFAEMLPKNYCRLKSEIVLVKHADSLNFILKILYYPTSFILRVVKWVVSPFGPMAGKSIFVSEQELRSLIEESTHTGVVEKHEKQIIDTILDFERIKVKSVMTPLDKVAKTDIHSTVGEVKKLATRTKARMVLVYEEDPALVVGMIYVFDLLFEEDNKKTMKQFLRAPIFLGGDSSIESAFLSLQEKRQSYAVVTDSSGETIGVVPIEKMLVM